MKNLIPPRYLDLDLHLYAGRYIALARGHVVATGDTAAEAQARATAVQPKRAAVVLYIAPDPDEDQEKTPS